MNRDMKKMIEAEVSKHPGVAIRYEQRGKHPSAVLTHGDASRFIVFTGTSTDRRGMLNKISDVRRAIREIGA